MDNIPSWVGIGLTVLAMAGGCIVYVHAQVGASARELHSRISSGNEKWEEKMQEARREFSARVEEEKGERRRDMDRIERTLEGFSQVASTVVGMGKSIEHLIDTVRIHQNHSDRAIDEVKHTVRAIDAQIRSTSTTEST